MHFHDLWPNAEWLAATGEVPCTLGCRALGSDCFQLLSPTMATDGAGDNVRQQLTNGNDQRTNDKDKWQWTNMTTTNGNNQRDHPMTSMTITNGSMTVDDCGNS